MVRKNSQGLQPIEPTCEEYFSVCGERILFQTNEASLLDAAGEILGCLLDEGELDGDPLFVQLFLVNEEEGTSPPPFDETTQPVFRMAGPFLSITLDRVNTAVIDLPRGFASGVLTARVVKGHPGLVRVFIRTMALNTLPLGRGLLPIHASCVVKGGLGVLFCSESGVGKSTLAMACVQHGYQLLADDAVFLRRDQDQIRIAGLPCQVRLNPQSLSLLETMDTGRDLKFANRKWKLHLELGQLYPGSQVSTAKPGLLIFLQREGTASLSALEPVSSSVADELLEVAWPYHLNWDDRAQANLENLLTLPAYRLSLGGDLAQTVGLIDQALAELGVRGE